MNSSQMPLAPRFRIGCTRPSQVLKIPRHAHPFRIRRPYTKVHAPHSLQLRHVSAQLFVVQVVRSLAQKVEVVLGEQRRKSVGIVGFERIAVRKANAKPVRPGSIFSSLRAARKSAGITASNNPSGCVCTARRTPRPSLETTLTSTASGTKHANDQQTFPVSLNPVRPQNLKWVGQLGSHHHLHRLRVGFRHCTLRRARSFLFGSYCWVYP